jgi:hypothetical protein
VSITRAAHTEVIRGTAQDCLDALLAFETYPQWQSAVEAVDVRQRDATGATVAFTIDAKVKTIRYVLRYHLDGRRLWWEYVDGDLEHVEGDYVLEEQDDGTTRATYAVGIDPGRFVPGPVKRLLVDVVMKGSVRDLRRYVESGPAIP